MPTLPWRWWLALIGVVLALMLVAWLTARATGTANLGATFPEPTLAERSLVLNLSYRYEGVPRLTLRSWSSPAQIGPKLRAGEGEWTLELGYAGLPPRRFALANPRRLEQLDRISSPTAVPSQLRVSFDWTLALPLDIVRDLAAVRRLTIYDEMGRRLIALALTVDPTGVPSVQVLP